MDSTDNNFPGEDAPESLEAEVASLRQQVWTLLVLALVVSGTLSIFLVREMTYARNDLAVLKTQVTPFLQEYQRESPNWDLFVSRMADYGKAHPDFMPILNKYIQSAPAVPAAPAKK